MISVDDGNGPYTANPGTDSSATLIPRVTVDELIALDLPDLVAERPVLELMARARSVREIHGALTRALAGADVGTVIHA